jgi:hypothetical protein
MFHYIKILNLQQFFTEPCKCCQHVFFLFSEYFIDFKLTLFIELAIVDLDHRASTDGYTNDWYLRTIAAIDANLITGYDWPIFKHILKFL